MIEESLFNRVQERFAKNKRFPTHFKAEDEYILTTKLFCGKCGNLLVGESGKSRTGDVHRYYKCSTAKRKHKCGLKAVRKQWIEDFVIAEAKKTLDNDKVLERIADSVIELANRENATVPMLRKWLGDIEKQIENMLNAIAQGIITPSTKQKLTELESEKTELEIRLLQEEMSQQLLTHEQILFWLHKFRELDMTQPEQRRRLIDILVNAVYVYDNDSGGGRRVVVTFNYKDGAATVSASDVDATFGSTTVSGAPP